jgi:hypothetical protein
MKIAVIKRFASGMALLALMGAPTASAQQSNKPNAAVQTAKHQCYTPVVHAIATVVI